MNEMPIHLLVRVVHSIRNMDSFTDRQPDILREYSPVVFIAVVFNSGVLWSVCGAGDTTLAATHHCLSTVIKPVFRTCLL